MPKADAIRVEGTVIEALLNTVYRVELPNHHRILAHLSGKARLSLVRFAPGEKVTVEMSPYDLSTGCILLSETKKI